MRKVVFSLVLFVVVTVCYAHTPPETILSAGALSKDALVAFLLANNPRMNSMNNNKVCVDPRYYKIEEAYGWGSSPTLDGLSGKWAGADYAHKIKKILAGMYRS